MPEVHLVLRWPDGREQACYSPSTVIEDALCAGAVYPVEELVSRASTALAVASDRVRAKYGFACTASAATQEAIARCAAPFAGDELVRVVRLGRAPSPRARPADLPRAAHDVVVVGGGQAGLSASWWLTQHGVDHVVLEAARVGHRWQTERWSSFCLVTPNWQCRLPGFPYAGADPDGFMLRDEVTSYVEAYAASFGAPVCEGVAVTAVRPRGGAGFLVETSEGTVSAGAVVLAVGGYHRAKVPALSAAVPAAITQLHSSTYRSPSALPDGAVLVVGSGQSGAQIAEDLHLAGRRVHLAVGSAPRVARRWRGRDVVAWLEDMGHYDVPVDEHPQGVGARREPNHYVTGRGGGRDIDLRQLAAEGLVLHGRLLDAAPDALTFAGDLAANLDAADATYARINATIDRWIAAQGIDAPPGAPYVPAWSPPDDGGGVVALAAAGITSIVWATGFAYDWSWVHSPAFTADAPHPDHDRGVTAEPGLYVLGLPWLHTWGSGRFAAIARDAEHVVGHLVATHRARAAA